MTKIFEVKYDCLEREVLDPKTMKMGAELDWERQTVRIEGKNAEDAIAKAKKKVLGVVRTWDVKDDDGKTVPYSIAVTEFEVVSVNLLAETSDD